MKYPTDARWLVETLHTREGWRSFIVIVLERKTRANFGIAHNGQRFARSTDLQRLCSDYPSIAEEVAEWAESA